MAYFYQIIILVVLLLTACKNTRKTIDQGVDALADLQCRAVQLNEKRFELFEQIRTLEVDSTANKVAIDSLKNVADSIKSQSLETADSLRIQLSDFLSSQNFSEPDRKYFDEKINSLVAKCKK